MNKVGHQFKVQCMDEDTASSFNEQISKLVNKSVLLGSAVLVDYNFEVHNKVCEVLCNHSAYTDSLTQYDKEQLIE